jgi:hypothetical protein
LFNFTIDAKDILRVGAFPLKILLMKAEYAVYDKKLSAGLIGMIVRITAVHKNSVGEISIQRPI